MRAVTRSLVNAFAMSSLGKAFTSVRVYMYPMSLDLLVNLLRYILAKIPKEFVKAYPLCRGQVVCPTTQDNNAVVERTRTSDVLLLLKTGPGMHRKWKTKCS